jgi:capsular exopolysaccharide synthesis family protein
MSEQPRYATLRDHLALLRRQRLVVLGVTAVFAAAAYLLSTSQTPEYEAEALVQFRDIAQDLPVLGAPAAVPESSAERAAVRAQSVTSARAARRARRELEPKVPPSTLRAAVTARVEALTNLVSVKATWDDPKFAADLANAFASEAARTAERQELGRIEAGIEELERQIRTDGSGVAADLRKAGAREQLGELEAARAVARPSRVTRRAEPPATAVSPRPLRNTILGALLGFALGLLAAFVRDSLDRRLRAPRDAHDELGLPILGRVGGSALGSSGLVGNGSGSLSPADLEAFRMLRTNISFFGAETPLRSVLVTSGVAGEGKSTVATSLASAAAAAGQRTLLVECDLRRPTLAGRLGLDESPGLSEYLSGAAGPREILQLREFGVSSGANGHSPSPAAAERSLVCITAGRPPAQPAELLASERCRDFFAKVGSVYDLVVIDSSPMLSAVDPLELIPLVDGVLVCVRLGLTTRDELRAVKSALRRLPRRPTGLVVTGLGRDEEEYAYYGAVAEA